MKFGLVTLFPEMFECMESDGVVGQACKKGLVQLKSWNPRDYTADVHRTIDDRPYGGGPGMVMMAEPLQKAIRAARNELGNTRVIHLSPRGKCLSQQDIKSLLNMESMILLCGRYEGIDERLIEREVDEEYSIGDYVLSGGELPAMVLIDAVVRLLPDVLGHEQSAVQDSFYHGLLDHPHYTRPDVWEEKTVPQELLSGNHDKIRKWRLKQALSQTLQHRPDLLEAYDLNAEETELLIEIKNEIN